MSESQKCKNGKNPALPKGGAGVLLILRSSVNVSADDISAITILWMPVISAAITYSVDASDICGDNYSVTVGDICCGNYSVNVCDICCGNYSVNASNM